jgi:homoserine dehydrogenase
MAPLRLLLAGFGSVGRRFVELLADRPAYPGLDGLDVVIVALTTGSHGAWSDPSGLAPAAILEQYRGHGGFPGTLDTLEASATLEYDVLLELSPLSIAGRGEPAISHVRAALDRGRHVVSANKGPVAWAWRELDGLARTRGARFLHDATVMDGAPVFNTVRNNLPGIQVLGFTGVLNSTTKIVVEAMREGRSFEDGVAEARKLGIAEADASYDTDGWDSAAKTAVLANVLMDARMTPLDVDRRGIGRLTPERVRKLADERKTVCLVSRAKRTPTGIKLRVRAEVLDDTDILASVHGTSNLLLFHTDLMGTIGTVSIAPQLEQTAYGVFSDLVDIARSV